MYLSNDCMIPVFPLLLLLFNSSLCPSPSPPCSQLGAPVEGLTQPWLYFGMLFATFCWHTEDHFLYSINYHHTGAPKTWYGIPALGARRFEMLLHDCAPTRFKEDPDLVHQLVAMLSPALIMSKNIPVVHALQSPGDIIVTFPRAYHAGFSHGWNCAEACNFALLDWVPAGRAAVERYSKVRDVWGRSIEVENHTHRATLLWVGGYRICRL